MEARIPGAKICASGLESLDSCAALVEFFSLASDGALASHRSCGEVRLSNDPNDY